MSGVLTGGNHGGKVRDPFDDFTGPQNVGHLFIVFKSNLFLNNYTSRIKQNIRNVKKLPKVNGIKEILYPGQSKFRIYKKNMKKKINIPKKILRDLNDL